MDNDNLINLSQLIEPSRQQKIITLPLQFQYLPVEVISKQFTKLNSNYPFRIYYLGPRFTNTLILHKKFSASQSQKTQLYFEQLLDYHKYPINLRKIVQSHFINEKLQNNHYYKSAIFYRAFQGMNPTLNIQQQFIFNSCFQSGNLDCVIKVNPMEFDLFLRIDSNTRGHTQWFYFSIQNGSKTGKVTLNICNLTKANTLYDQGMRPYIFSKRKYEKYKVPWQQDGENVTLGEKPLRYTMINQMIESHRVFRLSFDYTFTQTYDQVFFAYCIPYTFSQMIGDIKLLPKEYVRQQVLGRSLTGVDIPILHITNHELQTKKKNVLITGRIHPGESNSSHVLKGFMEYLCGDSKQGIELRKRINFFIIPMINPDGVILGNSRTSASGKDLNRQYLKNRRQLYPEVVLVKNLAYKLQRKYGLMMYFDFHGHSRKKNTFFYGPGYTLSDTQYYKSKALAKIIEKINNAFRYYSCSFMITDDKKRTARAVLFEQVKIPYTFTIQSSIGLFYDVNKLKTLQFTAQEWLTMGGNICKGLSEFIVAFEEYEEILRERRLQRKRMKEKKQKLLLRRTSKKLSEDDLEKDESRIQGQIGKKSMLMFELIEEIKQMPPKNSQEGQVSSDDHDEEEDLEISKLAQFNNLVIQGKQKDQKVDKLKPVEEEEELIKPRKIQKVDSDNDEFTLMKEIIDDKFKEKKKSKAFIPKSTEKTNIKNYSNKILKKTFTNPTCSVPKSTKLSLDKCEDEVHIVSPAKEPAKHRKSFNFQVHKHLISKQFFPVDKCEIVQWPKSSANNRKQIKKGRVFLEEYLNDKKKSNDERKPSTQEKPVRRKSDLSEKMALEQAKIGQRRMNKSTGKYEKKLVVNRNSNRIFDSLIFSGLQGMEIDNMAMMIRTFNK